MRRFSDLLKPISRFVHVHCVCVCVFAPHQKRFSRLMANTNNVNITIRHIHVVNVFFFLPKNRERERKKNRIQEVQFHYVSPHVFSRAGFVCSLIPMSQGRLPTVLYIFMHNVFNNRFVVCAAHRRFV